MHPITHVTHTTIRPYTHPHIHSPTPSIHPQYINSPYPLTRPIHSPTHPFINPSIHPHIHQSIQPSIYPIHLPHAHRLLRLLFLLLHLLLSPSSYIHPFSFRSVPAPAIPPLNPPSSHPSFHPDTTAYRGICSQGIVNCQPQVFATYRNTM